MKQKTIYTNGKCLFTLEDYGKTAGVCHVNGITLHSTVSILKARSMHSNGGLHYVSGTGDTINIKDLKLRRGSSYGPFTVN